MPVAHQFLREVASQPFANIAVLDVEEARSRRTAHPHRNPSLPPISGHLAERHEAVLVRDSRQCWVGTEACEGLPVATSRAGCEVADAVVAQRAVEAVADRRGVMIAGNDPRRAKWVRRSRNSPQPPGRWREQTHFVGQPPARKASAARTTSRNLPSRNAVAGDRSSSCGFRPRNQARTVCWPSCVCSSRNTW